MFELIEDADAILYENILTIFAKDHISDINLKDKIPYLKEKLSKPLFKSAIEIIIDSASPF